VARGSVQVWTINDDRELAYVHGIHCSNEWLVCPDSIMQSHSPVFKRPYIARSVQFCDSGEVVLGFYLESHEMYVY
jgi:hypothetical protein